VGETLRVMTFNIRGFYHPDDGVNQWRHREALNIATIRRAAPDMIGVQEAQTGNLKAYHRELREYWWAAWPEYGDAPPHEWPAIYWRPDVVQPIDSGGFWLSETPERHSRSWNTDCIRSASWVAFRWAASGAEFVLLNTHLDHRSAEARIEGARLIVRRLDALQADGRAAIVTGDFNDDPGSPAYQTFVDAGFADAYVAAGYSDEPLDSYTNHGWRGYPFDRPDDRPRRIDWIMTRGGASTNASTTSCEIARDAAPPVYPSDHYPVVADVALARPE
jgi:endonuclease/exonuclease/phosphatase family metal-dependent hydrolase